MDHRAHLGYPRHQIPIRSLAEFTYNPAKQLPPPSPVIIVQYSRSMFFRPPVMAASLSLIRQSLATRCRTCWWKALALEPSLSFSAATAGKRTQSRAVFWHATRKADYISRKRGVSAKLPPLILTCATQTTGDRSHLPSSRLQSSPSSRANSPVRGSKTVLLQLLIAAVLASLSKAASDSFHQTRSTKAISRAAPLLSPYIQIFRSLARYAIVPHAVLTDKLSQASQQGKLRVQGDRITTRSRHFRIPCGSPHSSANGQYLCL